MGRAILKAILPLCLAALVLFACSEDGGESDRSQTGTASGGESTGTAKVRTQPEDGNLSAGRYSTSERFEPSFSFELGEGWLVLRPSEPQSLKLGYVAPGQEVAQGKGLRFLNVREVFGARDGEPGRAVAGSSGRCCAVRAPSWRAWP